MSNHSGDGGHEKADCWPHNLRLKQGLQLDRGQLIWFGGVRHAVVGFDGRNMAYMCWREAESANGGAAFDSSHLVLVDQQRAQIAPKDAGTQKHLPPLPSLNHRGRLTSESTAASKTWVQNSAGDADRTLLLNGASTRARSAPIGASCAPESKTGGLEKKACALQMETPPPVLRINSAVSTGLPSPSSLTSRFCNDSPDTAASPSLPTSPASPAGCRLGKKLHAQHATPEPCLSNIPSDTVVNVAEVGPHTPKSGMSNPADELESAALLPQSDGQRVCLTLANFSTSLRYILRCIGPRFLRCRVRNRNFSQQGQPSLNVRRSQSEPIHQRASGNLDRPPRRVQVTLPIIRPPCWKEVLQIIRNELVQFDEEDWKESKTVDLSHWSSFVDQTAARWQKHIFKMRRRTDRRRHHAARKYWISSREPSSMSMTDVEKREPFGAFDHAAAQAVQNDDTRKAAQNDGTLNSCWMVPPQAEHFDLTPRHESTTTESVCGSPERAAAFESTWWGLVGGECSEAVADGCNSEMQNDVDSYSVHGPLFDHEEDLDDENHMREMQQILNSMEDWKDLKRYTGRIVSLTPTSSGGSLKIHTVAFAERVGADGVKVIDFVSLFTRKMVKMSGQVGKPRSSFSFFNFFGSAGQAENLESRPAQLLKRPDVAKFMIAFYFRRSLASDGVNVFFCDPEP